MFRSSILSAILLCLTFTAMAGTHQLPGKITDSTGEPLTGASVALLYPVDSTMAAFAISNDGSFLIRDVQPGTYILQASMMGFYSEYRSVTLPLTVPELPELRLMHNHQSTLMNEVVISAERIPIRVKGDTLEYNAGSYKVKPNAVVEDLLRKLPGIQVDKEGNIKSMGKTVTKVLVDGKEFFGNDPKVATKNLPADAIDKVQAFEKKSDQTLFSGIDDGDREQTLNLMLKADKKTGYFGEASGALGLPEQYDAGLKAFKFRTNSQIAALGMLNNINKFGFTLQDYLDYNGGIGSMMGEGGNINFNTNDMPVDFGQPVTGKVTSGALGFNYAVTPRTGNRFNISYMGNGMEKLLERQSLTRNFTPLGNFNKEDQGQSKLQNIMNNLSSSWRNQVDSFHLLTLNAYAKLDNNRDVQSGFSESYITDRLQNRLERKSNTKESGSGMGITAGITKKINNKWHLLQAKVTADYTERDNNSQWQNNMRYTDSNMAFYDAQFQDNHSRLVKTTAAINLVRRLGGTLYLEPQLAGSVEREITNREQGLYQEARIDSLSPRFYRDVWSFSPGILVRSNKKVLKWQAGLKGKTMLVAPYLNASPAPDRQYNYLLPNAFLEWNIKSGERLSMRYTTDATAPSATQLMPYTNYNNPLTLSRGNIELGPEYAHNLNLNYSNFDQFSMSSLFAFINARYTLNKIDWERTVYPDLSQLLQMTNTRYAAQLVFNGQYARPVRKLGVNVSFSLEESWNRSVSPVNSVENTNNTLTHKLSMEFSNLDNDVWDLRWGGDISISNARYSQNRELNNNYTNYTGFARIEYQPGENWRFSASADITHYTAKSFDAAITIPIIKAEISRYILRNQRGTLTLKGFDLLNRNSSVQRISQLSYLIEQRSNVIGRYFMLSFAYKLNRAGKSSKVPGSIEIKG